MKNKAGYFTFHNKKAESLILQGKTTLSAVMEPMGLEPMTSRV